MEYVTIETVKAIIMHGTIIMFNVSMYRTSIEMGIHSLSYPYS